MNLSTHGCEISTDMSAAIQRGLDAVGQSEATVIVSGDFVKTVERLDPTSGPYDTDRGFGVVGAKTITQAETTTIVLNSTVMLEAPLADVERLLAHEGGHAVLHAHDEAMATPQPNRSTSGLAMLRAVAGVAIEEFRVERRVAELGYPSAQLSVADSLDDQLFDFCCEVFEALHDSSSDDVFLFATRILAAQHRLTISLSYLAGAVVVGATSFDVDHLSNFGQQYWTETVERTWRDRLQLYQRIPAAGTRWSGSLASTHLRQAVELERKLLRDVGFTLRSNDAQPNSRWSFLRTGKDEMFDAQQQRLFAEVDRREAEAAAS